MTVARLAGRVPGFPQAPGFLPQVAGTGPCWSADVRQRADPLPGAGDRFGPGPVRGEFPAAPAPAADQAGGGVQDPVAQRLGLGPGEVAVESEELEPGEQDLRDHGRGQPGLVEGVAVGGEPADPGVLASADAVLDPGMDAVAGVDEGSLAAPAFRGGRQVGDPQLVPVAILMLEKRELGAGVGPLAASEDPHRLGPAFQLVPARAFTQQPGQLGDVRFLDPAGPVTAFQVAAGIIGAALA